MKIIDLDQRNKPAYFHCLEEWSPDMQESGDRKSCWHQIMKDKGLRVKLAVDDDNNTVGMIQYVPIEHSHVTGKNLYFIYCIWVHGHKQGVGNCQKNGIGTLLLETAEQDALSSGASGMAAWGLAIPVWMKASWFKKHGYIKSDRDGLAVLLWKPFSDNADAPGWLKQKIKPDLIQGKVTVTSFTSGWCPAQNITHERAKRASETFGGRVVFREIDTLDPENLHRWGIADGVFIDGKPVGMGPPPSFEKISKMITKSLKRLK